jgi:hypothetical protein
MKEKVNDGCSCHVMGPVVRPAHLMPIRVTSRICFCAVLQGFSLVRHCNGCCWWNPAIQARSRKFNVNNMKVKVKVGCWCHVMGWVLRPGHPLQILVISHGVSVVCKRMLGRVILLRQPRPYPQDTQDPSSVSLAASVPLWSLS